MLLTMDVGNTQTAIGVFEGDELRGHWRFSTRADRSTDEYRVYLPAILALEGFSPEQITGAAIASVVPVATNALRGIASEIASGPTVVVEAGVKTGVPILIDNPREVGADRVMNSMAGMHKYGAPVIVVDFGTSTNFDVVDADGAYIGGAIAPGAEVSHDVLIGRTAALRRVELVPPRSVIGKGTVEAIQSGLVFGHAGMVDGIIDRLKAELGGDPTVVATGGLAPTIVPHCRNVEQVDEFLTLDGLHMVFHLNVEEEN
jgi:type III pantothenate kinase